MRSPDGAPLTPIKRALVEIRHLRARLAEAEASRREPIAIVGMGLRFPGGACDAESFARNLWSGADAVTEIPADRWSLDAHYAADPDAPGKMTTRHGAFLEEVDKFDAEFFGIAPREAVSMDPQHRLVLELAWEALEDAGCAPYSLTGARAGVYLGIANGDYGRALFSHPDLIDPYFSTGNAFSVAAGRVSYHLGLHGPSIALDTACSSSLVALHLACQGLRTGECDLALAGGVNLILTPEININFSKAGMMSREGLCKTFDASADGYVRGEGGGIIVLKRLRDAQADGDRILAVVRGSALNQDGRSNGLTAPNGPAQEAVIRAALSAAGVAPGGVSYVEAHGTGTPLGDPIEVNAMAAVLTEDREGGSPLMIGSVKTNIGHLEAAAGIAGVIKTVLMLQHRKIAPHLHLQTKNPHIDWAALPITIPTARTPWEPIAGRRVAGVSSFGFSGTNAHVVLEEAPSTDTGRPAAPDRSAHILTLSARDESALRALAHRYEETLHSWDDERGGVEDVCFTANAGRSHFAHRVAVVGASTSAIADGLAKFGCGEAHARVVSATAGAEPPRLAFLFPGQGVQYAGMGRELYDAAPAFRDAFDRCADVLDALLPQSIRSVIFPAPGAATPLHETAYAQPAMFAIEYALANLWRSWGIEPAAVMGHSFGEYAAACVSHAIPLTDAARIVVARGRLAQQLPGDGAMTVLEAPEQAVAEALTRAGGRVSIAAVNGPANTVISGERCTVDAVAADFSARGARVKPLRVSHAFHSPLVEPMLDAFEREVSSVEFEAPRLMLASGLTGSLADQTVIGRAAYWREHLRQKVRFADSIRALAAQGITHFVEVSPHPVLLGMGSECVQGGQWLPSMREGQSAWSTLLESVQLLYRAGAEIDWRALDGGASRRRVRLPTYPFRRKRQWLDAIGTPQSPPIGSVARWERLTSALDREALRGPLDLDPRSYPAKWGCLARLTSAHAIQIFREAGLFGRSAERHSLDSVMSTARIGATYRRLVRRWLESLVECGVLRAEGPSFVADQPLPDPGLPALWREADALFADNRSLLDYVRNCASILGPVLRGEESPLETLFPKGNFELAQALYEQSTAMRYVNGLAGAAFEALSSATPQGRQLRVLEIGAGTGGTTSSLLPFLSADTARYLFTDVSDVFLTHARQRFGGLGFVEFALFDLDADFVAQGYAPGSFDVIVSANCVHAVRDLRAALERLRALLSPGGVLMLVESTTHLAYFDMTTGLIEGWQHFADDLRTDNPLLTPPAWIGALAQAGFAEARAWPPEGSLADSIALHVIVARAPGDAAAGAVAAGVAPVASADIAPVARDDASGSKAWLQRLEQAVPAERLDLMREMVCSTVMRVMRLDDESRPARHERLMDLGMDSLMAVQLRNGLNDTLALPRSLSSTLMFDYPTIDAIAKHLLERSGTAAVESVHFANGAGADDLVERLDRATVAAMSDDDIAKLLEQRLDA
jgi:acyl transferase domain-containing protein/SAM-dependent methyltransferase